MATVATTAKFFCQVTGGDSGDKTVSIPWSLSAPLLQVDRTTITQGSFATITVPAGAKLAVIVPPSGNSQAITFKGVSGDTGYAIDPNETTIIAVSGASFVLALAAGTNQTVEISWL